MSDCGGCRGEGAHKRWCAAHVGLRASLLGTYAEQAEALADSVGSLHPGAANRLYAAAGVLLEAAQAERKDRK